MAASGSAARVAALAADRGKLGASPAKCPNTTAWFPATHDIGHPDGLGYTGGMVLEVSLCVLPLWAVTVQELLLKHTCSQRMQGSQSMRHGMKAPSQPATTLMPKPQKPQHRSSSAHHLPVSSASAGLAYMAVKLSRRSAKLYAAADVDGNSKRRNASQKSVNRFHPGAHSSQFQVSKCRCFPDHMPGSQPLTWGQPRGSQAVYKPCRLDGCACCVGPSTG